MILAIYATLWHVSRRIRLGLVDPAKLQINLSIGIAAALAGWVTLGLIVLFVLCQSLISDTIVIPRAPQLHLAQAPIVYWMLFVVYFVAAWFPLASTAIVICYGRFQNGHGGR